MSVGTQSAPIVVRSATACGGDTDAGAVRNRDINFREFRRYRYTHSMNFAIARIIRVAQILVSKELHDVVLTNVDHLC